MGWIEKSGHFHLWGLAMRVFVCFLLLISTGVLNGCSVMVIAADAAVSAGVAVVGTAADITVAGVKAVTGGRSDEKK
ncbi:MAG: hypothetical protein Q8O25_00905 [Sulfurisoma sp.]|nr:hypothetical protein [Sulfurisoma sp.]